jgi:thiol-disulfide isomerase/thioredoxin
MIQMRLKVLLSGFCLSLGCTREASQTDTTVSTDSGAFIWSGPELLFRTCEGENQSLKDLAQGHNTLLAIGAAWCEPCQEDAPVIEDFAASWPAIVVAQVLVEDWDGDPATSLTCQDWVSSFEVSYLVLTDAAFETRPLIGDEGFPFHLAFLADGTQVLGESGFFDEVAVLEALNL